MPTPPELPIRVLLDDVIRLEHMVLAAEDVEYFCEARNREQLNTDRMFRRALVHAVQEIGEAASKITIETRRLLPDVPWGSIVQTRHIVVHVYWGVDLDRIWTVAVLHVPPLRTKVKQWLAHAEPYEQT